MSQQQNVLLTQQEGRLTLALQAFRTGQFQSVRRAAAAFNVQHQRLADRLNGILSRHETPVNSLKLTLTEERVIVRHILDLDARGFAPRLSEVEDIADKILVDRDATRIGTK
jgi:hypothetical protein